MVKVVFTKEDKVTKKKTTQEFECEDCKVFDSIVVMKGVKGNTAKIVRVPLFKIDLMETFD